MVAREDFALSAEEISAKYPKGSPDYPSHCKTCECSGCAFSWAEWRAGNTAYAVGFDAGVAKAKEVCADFLRSAQGEEKMWEERFGTKNNFRLEKAVARKVAFEDCIFQIGAKLQRKTK